MTAWPRLTSHTLRASSRICLFHLQQRLRTMIAGKHRSATIKVQFVENQVPKSAFHGPKCRFTGLFTHFAQDRGYDCAMALSMKNRPNFFRPCGALKSPNMDAIFRASRVLN